MIPQQNINRKRRLSQNSESARLLSDLVDRLDLILTIGNQPVAVARHGLDGVLRMRRAREYKMRRQALKRLQEKELIKLTKNAQGYWIALTDKGLAENFRQKVLNSDIFEDDHFCMVVFDIPERFNKLRQRLRAFLKEAGFNSLQRSVWISQFNATDALNELFKATGAKQWVRVYTVIDKN